MSAVDAVLADWRAAWPRALDCWSRYTRLSEPRWCQTPQDREREGLSGSFAMIRLTDHAVVVDLAEIAARRLEGYALEILAHEIGHHVLVPADLRDNALLLARVRVGLPGVEDRAPMVANLWADLLINDRLQRQHGLDLAGVFRSLREDTSSRLWRLYLRIYERLWRLPQDDLGAGEADVELDLEAELGARAVRVYARDWLVGASRFACLLHPYLLQEREERAEQTLRLGAWLDALRAGAGDQLPEGLAQADLGEHDALHPAEDPRLSALGAARARGDRFRPPDELPQREPADYVALMQALGVELEERELVVRYYRELASPHLTRFPQRILPAAIDPLPEGLETWDVGGSLETIDWNESAARGGVVIPGVTTLQRSWGQSPGQDPQRQPLDLYIGIDCSGSMGNPAHTLSYPVLAGTIVALSAFRHRARVRACLSGETPGRFVDSGAFDHDQQRVLATLCDYLGTGYSFGIERLREAFLGQPIERPTHILLLSDWDWFHMLDQGATDGWEVARRAVERAGGGATAVLHLQRSAAADAIARLERIGWSVHCVSSEPELISFARAFSRQAYSQELRT